MKLRESKTPPVIDIGVESPWVYIQLTNEGLTIRARLKPEVALQVADSITEAAVKVGKKH